MTLVGPPANPVVIDRRRLDFTKRGIPRQVYHAARSVAPAKADALIARASESAAVTAERGLRSLIGDLRGRGYEVAASGIVLGGGRLMPPSGGALLSHAGSHAAEGEIFRQALLRASDSLRLPVTAIAERDLYDRGSALLAISATRLREQVAALGKQVGAPWGQDQKSAAVIAWLSLITRRASTVRS